MKKLKNIIKLSILAAVLGFTLSGCVNVTYSGGSGSKESINGKGEMITKEYPVEKYNSVVIDVNAAIVYTAADSDIVKVELQENLAECLYISVVNEQLVVRSDKDFITNDDKTPVIYITVPTLNEMIFEGFVKLKESDPIQSSELHLSIDGSLNGKLAVDTETLVWDFNGVGNIALSGRASRADFTLDGAGTLNALELETDNASVDLNGAGDISLSCSDTLDIQIDGAGTVNYRGTPSIRQEISGIGSVNQVD